MPRVILSLGQTSGMLERAKCTVINENQMSSGGDPVKGLLGSVSFGRSVEVLLGFCAQLCPI